MGTTIDRHELKNEEWMLLPHLKIKRDELRKKDAKKDGENT